MGKYSKKVEEAVDALIDDFNPVSFAEFFFHGGHWLSNEAHEKRKPTDNQKSIEGVRNTLKTSAVSSYSDGGWNDLLIAKNQAKKNPAIMSYIENSEVEDAYLQDGETNIAVPSGTHYFLMPANGSYCEVNLTDEFIQDHFFAFSEEDQE